MTSFLQMRVLLSLFIVTAVTAANDMRLERIIMQLRSQVNSDSAELNSNVELLTSKYLNDYYGAYYSTNYNEEGYFLESTLSVSSLGIHGVEGSFITTLEIDGSLVFDPNMEAPSKPFVDTLLRNAFQGHNERIYLNQLLSTINSDSDFLHQLTHIFIEIDDVTVAETKIQQANEVGTAENSNNNSTGATSQSIPDPQADDGHWLMDEEWVRITTFSAAGVVGALLLIGCCCLLRCFCCRGSRKVVVEDEDDELGDEPIKILALPVKNSRSRSANTTPTSQSNTERSDSSSFDDQMGRSPPSPVRSLASQDSSKFSYSNNNNLGNLNTSRFSLGSFSKFSMDMQASIDLDGATQQSNYRPNTISNGSAAPPFGHDISAIENRRDLSLIEEEDDDEEMGHHHLARARKYNARRSSRNDHPYLSSRTSFGSKASNDRRSRSTSRSRHAQTSSAAHRFSFARRHNDYDNSESSIDLDTSSSDVIADLRNLSLQIEKQRKNRKAPDPR